MQALEERGLRICGAADVVRRTRDLVDKRIRTHETIADGRSRRRRSSDELGLRDLASADTDVAGGIDAYGITLDCVGHRLCPLACEVPDGIHDRIALDVDELELHTQTMRESRGWGCDSATGHQRPV